jgi:hypothetical protein
MWKQGHIRILTRVTSTADGSVQFATAESSSIDLVGPPPRSRGLP